MPGPPPPGGAVAQFADSIRELVKRYREGRTHGDAGISHWIPLPFPSPWLESIPKSTLLLRSSPGRSGRTPLGCRFGACGPYWDALLGSLGICGRTAPLRHTPCRTSSDIGTTSILYDGHSAQDAHNTGVMGILRTVPRPIYRGLKRLDSTRKYNVNTIRVDCKDRGQTPEPPIIRVCPQWRSA